MTKMTTRPKADNQKSKLNDSNKEAQKKRLYDALRKGPVTTIMARHELNIMAPAARIYELRYDDGINIVTHNRVALTPEGFEHTVAEYVLLSGKWEGLTYA